MVEELTEDDAPGWGRLPISSARTQRLLAQRRLLHPLVLVLVALAVMVSLAPARNAPGYPDDEGLLLVYPEQVLNGAIPNRGYETFYGAGDTYLLAAVYAVTGPRVGVERAIGLAYRVTIAAAVFALAALDGVVVGLAAGLLSAVVFTSWDFTWIAFGWLGGVSLALLSLWSWLFALRGVCRSPQPWFVGAGALAGFAVFVRFDLFPAVVLAALPLLIASPRRQRPWLALGLALPVFALAIHLALAGAGHVISNLAGGVFRSGNQDRYPLPAGGAAEWWSLVLVASSPPLLLVAGLAARLRDAPSVATVRLLALGLFSLGLVVDVLHRVDYPHLMFAGCVSIGLLPVALVSLIKNAPLRAPMPSLISGAVATLLALYGLATNIRQITTKDDPRASWVTHRGRLWPAASPAQAALINETLTEVERLTKPGERLFVGPANLRRTIYNDIYFYHLLPQLRPASYYLDMNPGTANRPGSSLASDIASANVLVLTTEYDSIQVWKELAPYSRLGSNAPNQTVARDFRLQATYGPFLVYTRRQSAE
ncbi:MAG: hypothetical protein JO372_05660 [Solirubrobacterales bacterium]|nr:hypothetical protein [Solirubrobacterales bacterium]